MYHSATVDSWRHNLDEKDGIKYTCPTCNRGFSRAYNLKSHIRTHQDYRPFECNVCQLRFTRNHDLNRHLRTHSKEKGHICDDCGRQFARRDALRRHERMDEEGKKIHCISGQEILNTVPFLQQISELSAAQTQQFQAHMLQVQAAQLQSQQQQQQQQGSSSSAAAASELYAQQQAAAQIRGLQAQQVRGISELRGQRQEEMDHNEFVRNIAQSQDVRNKLNEYNQQQHGISVELLRQKLLQRQA